jgi:hypothetical protein
MFGIQRKIKKELYNQLKPFTPSRSLFLFQLAEVVFSSVLLDRTPDEVENAAG